MSLMHTITHRAGLAALHAARRPGGSLLVCREARRAAPGAGQGDECTDVIRGIDIAVMAMLAEQVHSVHYCLATSAHMHIEASIYVAC